MSDHLLDDRLSLCDIREGLGNPPGVLDARALLLVGVRATREVAAPVRASMMSLSVPP